MPPGVADPSVAPGPSLATEECLLPDGGRIVLRPVTPADRQRIVEGFDRLSPETRRLRFHEPRQSLSPADLEFLSTIDHDQHVSWCACLPDGTGVGIARYVVDPEGGKAEIAIVVVDTHQHRGIGRALLRKLAAIAGARGIAMFHATVLAENSVMRGLIENIAVEVSATEGVLRYEVPVAAIARLPV